MSVTVVMLNWKRPANVREFAAKYVEMPLVDAVIVFNCNPMVNFLLPLKKTTTINASSDPGLTARFAAAGLAKTDTVLLCDDDIELPEPTVKALCDRYGTSGVGLVGIFGRNTDEHGDYKLGDVQGNCEIVLTRALVTSPRLCCLALPYTTRMANQLGGEPYGNGEDIVLSYMARRYAGDTLAVKLPFKNRGYDGLEAISVRYEDHLRHRARVVKWCRENIENADADDVKIRPA